jgi:hypothetical protein
MRDHPFGLFLFVGVGIPTKLKIDAPNFIGLPMKQDPTGFCEREDQTKTSVQKGNQPA